MVQSAINDNPNQVTVEWILLRYHLSC